MRTLLFGTLCGLALGCNEGVSTTPAVPATKGGPAGATTSRDRDNTCVNARDSGGATKTPIDQNENKADIAVTAEIRKRVVDTQMSVNAQNVKIITQAGKVTLRGPVKTVQEKQQVEEIARAVAGANQVDSQLEVEAR